MAGRRVCLIHWHVLKDKMQLPRKTFLTSHFDQLTARERQNVQLCQDKADMLQVAEM